MTDGDDKLTRAYRGLAREEPTRALDAAILAASSRALQRPSATRRWAVPVSIAAMLVLAIGVTLEMQHEEPGVETSAPGRGAIPPRAVAPQPAPLPQAQAPVTPPEEVKPAPPPSRRPQARARSSEPPPSAAKSIAQPSEAPAQSAPREKREAVAAPPPREEAMQPLAPAAAAPARVAPASPQAFPLQEKRMAPAGSSADTQAPATANTLRPQSSRATPMAKELRALTPEETELERIATLRAQGRDAEADKALEEFRRAHPDYRIPDAVWERVKPR